tara:strand:+ start:145 stop:327 length:183 start_codon:yes stop_codon:yes gene_type:complete
VAILSSKRFTFFKKLKEMWDPIKRKSFGQQEINLASYRKQPRKGFLPDQKLVSYQQTNKL